MLYLIDNERAYEFHRLLLVETDVDARQVELLLLKLGAEDKKDPAPNIILLTDPVNWKRRELEMALFDCELWRLFDADAEGAEVWDSEAETRARTLMNEALALESADRLRYWAATNETYGALAQSTFGYRGSYDSTVPKRAAAELERRRAVAEEAK